MRWFDSLHSECRARQWLAERAAREWYRRYVAKCHEANRLALELESWKRLGQVMEIPTKGDK